MSIVELCFFFYFKVFISDILWIMDWKGERVGVGKIVRRVYLFGRRMMVVWMRMVVLEEIGEFCLEREYGRLLAFVL